MSQPFRQDDDDEDFNMFVSPSRFSGRTPSAATAKSRVFQNIVRNPQPQQQQPPALAENRPPRLPKQSTISRDASTVDIESQALTRRRVTMMNWCAAVVGFVILAISIWIGKDQFDVVLTNSFIVTTPLLRMPIFLSAALFVGGTAMLICGVVLGIGVVAEALSAGIVTKSQRTACVLYQICLFLALIAFAIVLVACTAGLVGIKGRQTVDIRGWARVDPIARCQYQRRGNCVGVVGGNCLGGVVCPGHSCNACRIDATGKGCAKCARLIADKPLLDACVRIEKSPDSRGCGELVLRQLRIVLVTAVFAAVLGIVSAVAVGVVDLLVSA